MPKAFPGYRGYANIGTIGNVRFGDANINATQQIDAPDLIMGDWDHDAYVYGKIDVGGSISGPVTETFTLDDGIFVWGCKRGGACGALTSQDIELFYYCGTPDSGNNINNYRRFENVFVNSLGFSCSAGDIAQFTLDVIGTKAEPWEAREPINLGKIGTLPSEKLITWDKVGVSININNDDVLGNVVSDDLNYSNFDFTINNNLEAIYSLSQTNLYPFEVVPGLRGISGSLSVYNTPDFDGVDSWNDYIAANVSVITFNIGALEIDMRVRFHRVEAASTTGTIISTVGFTGVTHQTGAVWED